MDAMQDEPGTQLALLAAGLIALRQEQTRRKLADWLAARDAASAEVPYGIDPVEAAGDDWRAGQSECYLDDPAEGDGGEAA